MLESKRLILHKPDLSFNAPLYDIHSDRQATQYTLKRRHTDITETNNMLKDWINHWHKYSFGYFVIVEKIVIK
jgi:ribosomal-protein-alanine N-acetyltransferase